MPSRREIVHQLRDRRGIALPMVLLVTLMLTISVGAGFMIAANEHNVGTDHDAQLKAYAVAQQGVERYLTGVTSLPTTFPDTRTISVVGGSATVTLNLIRAGTASYSAIYALTSVGDATAARLRRTASTPVGERTIAQMVTWQSGDLNADAAFTSLSGLNVKNGSSGTVSGVNLADASTSCPAGGTDIAGLAIPNAGLNMNGHNTNFIDGTPDNVPIYIGTAGAAGTAKDAVDVDWAGILAGSIAPDFLLDRTAGKHNGTWPTTAQFANWPVVEVKGDVLNGDNINGGQGVLIVTGDADLSNFTWHGVVLVGGAITLSGSQANVWGSLFTGLNVKLGQTVAPGDVGNGNVLVQYNSCDIAKALLKFGGWRRVQNTWADNWPSYTVP